MIGVIILTHGRFGEELYKSAEMILGKQDKVEVVSVKAGFSMNDIAGPLEDIININGEDCSLVFTDMFGGTPSNISIAYLKDKTVEVVSGVNLPMLLKAFVLRMEKDISLAEVAAQSAIAGQESIKVAGELLTQKKDE